MLMDRLTLKYALMVLYLLTNYNKFTFLVTFKIKKKIPMVNVKTIITTPIAIDVMLGTRNHL